MADTTITSLCWPEQPLLRTSGVDAVRIPSEARWQQTTTQWSAILSFCQGNLSSMTQKNHFVKPLVGRGKQLGRILDSQIKQQKILKTQSLTDYQRPLESKRELVDCQREVPRTRNFSTKAFWIGLVHYSQESPLSTLIFRHWGALPYDLTPVSHHHVMRIHGTWISSRKILESVEIPTLLQGPPRPLRNHLQRELDKSLPYGREMFSPHRTNIFVMQLRLTPRNHLTKEIHSQEMGYLLPTVKNWRIFLPSTSHVLYIEKLVNRKNPLANKLKPRQNQNLIHSDILHRILLQATEQPA